MKKTIQSKFFGELEAVRGLACLSVVACHCYMITVPKWGDSTGEQIAKIVAEVALNGQSVVLLFFVLSGFVLGCLLDKAPIKNFGDYCRYLFRRGCRLVPPSWVSIAFAIVLSATVFSWREILEAVVFYSFVPNVVLWSMHVELIASALFPVMYWVARKRGPVVNLALIAVLSAATLSETPSFTQYMVFFHTGLLVSHMPESWIRKLSPSAGFVLLCLSLLAMLSMPHLIVDKSKHNYLASWNLWLWAEIIPTFLIVYIIAAQKGGSIQRFLRLKGVQYIGTISLGMYLFHLQMITIVVPMIDSNMSFWKNSSGEFLRFIVIYISTLLATLPLAFLMYGCVERPFIALGRGSWRGIAREPGHGTEAVEAR